MFPSVDMVAMIIFVPGLFLATPTMGIVAARSRRDRR